jgi:hypothetical protein
MAGSETPAYGKATIGAKYASYFVKITTYNDIFTLRMKNETSGIA